MKRMGYWIVIFTLVSGLYAQQEPKIRESGENFAYVGLECLGPYTQISQKLGELVAEVQKQKLEMMSGPVIIYYNSPAQVKPEELRWEVCLPLDTLAPVAAPLKKGVYKHARVAEMIFRGPYESVGSAYPPLMEFIAKNGYAVSGPACETYMDDPGSTKPEDCRTLIVIPVQK